MLIGFDVKQSSNATFDVFIDYFLKRQNGSKKIPTFECQKLT